MTRSHIEEEFFSGHVDHQHIQGEMGDMYAQAKVATMEEEVGHGLPPFPISKAVHTDGSLFDEV